MNGIALLELARAIAEVTHSNQSRKGTGEPYMNHVQRVVDGVQGWEAKVVGYLHDVVEDTPVDFETLRVLGFPDRILHAVALLTKDGDRATYEQQLLESGNKIACRVKLADVQDNLRDIDNISELSPTKKAQYLNLQAQLLNVLERK